MSLIKPTDFAALKQLGVGAVIVIVIASLVWAFVSSFFSELGKGTAQEILQADPPEVAQRAYDTAPHEALSGDAEKADDKKKGGPNRRRFIGWDLKQLRECKEMKWTVFLLLAALAVANTALAQDEPSAADRFSIDTSYQTDDERAGALLNCVEALATTLIPAGAVMAFDLPNGCPKGWRADISDAEGRVIVGVNGEDFRLPYEGGKPRYDLGGSQTVALKPHHLPGHTHSGTTKSANTENYRIVFTAGDSVLENHVTGFRSGGGHRDTTNSPLPGSIHTHDFETDMGSGLRGTAIGIMPPYIALYYCKKEAS